VAPTTAAPLESVTNPEMPEATVAAFACPIEPQTMAIMVKIKLAHLQKGFTAAEFRKTE